VVLEGVNQRALGLSSRLSALLEKVRTIPAVELKIRMSNQLQGQELLFHFSRLTIRSWIYFPIDLVRLSC